MPNSADRSTGVDEIQRERIRQITELGYTIDIDFSQNSQAELTQAAISYIAESEFLWPANWPNVPSYPNRIKTLAKAGACIAAEIDRLKHIQTLAESSKDADFDDWL